MAEFEPLVIDNVALMIGSVDYGAEVDSVLLVPTTPKVKFKGVNGKKSGKVAKPDWVLTLNLGQSFDKAALSAQLIEQHGKKLPFTISPEGESGVSKVTGTVLMEAAQVGGASEGIATASVTLDVENQPVFAWRDAAK